MPCESLEALCEGYLTPHVPWNRSAVVPWGEWSLYLNNGPLGTDTGMLPSKAAKELDCRAIRATAADPGPDEYGAAILEVFHPDEEEDLLRCRRALYAADDGGRWVFGQAGELFDFEDVIAYRKRRIRDRFTLDMLRSYLRHLGVPTDTDPEVALIVLVEMQ